MNRSELKNNFINLIVNNQGILHKISYLYCNEIDDRNDLIQDILMQLWTAYPKFRGDSKISTWIYRIALNTAINRLRKATKKNQEQCIDNLQFDLQEEETYNEKEEKNSLVQTALSKLNKPEKALIILYMNDYQYDEIVEIIGITQTNVGVKINRIKKKLKTIITELQNGI